MSVSTPVSESARPFSSRLLRLLAGTLLGAALTLGPGPLSAQGSAHDYEADEAQIVIPTDLLEGVEFRSLEFTRGGRSTAVAGVRGQPLVYYFGGTGGGVFKTTNAGNTWDNVTDGFLGVGSVGAIAVAESDPNVVWVGTGSACPRGNISNGDGMYRSTDAGTTWQRVGLEQAGQIGRIRVHPRDENVAWVAALGNLFGPNEERGVFRTKDGGQTWEKVLYISEYTGFVDLAIDATNPRVLYAAAWRAERKPWTLISGSEEGGLWKTTDGGDTWEKLGGGLPEGLVGRIGVAVSPADPSRVWALVEAEDEEGGLYRSDDAGESWTRINGDANLRQRPWYYTHIYADTEDANTVYGLNTGLYRSVDGGHTFAQPIEVPHGDNHDLWINPDDPSNMINANDGGANVTFDGGATWSWQMNQPTAEIYRVFVDEQWPYRVYGPQQDNSAISIPSRGGVAWNRIPPDWENVGGCESGHIAIDPRDPDVVYAGCYGGSLSRVDLETGDYREIISYPQLQLGAAPRDLRYRFQWNAPIRLSPHDPSVLYHASQVVHRSTDEGQSWEVISPDLTTDDLEQQDYTGGPISRDSTGVEVYNTIFALEESTHREGEIWVGSDDGRIHVSRDNGANWEEVTPKGMPAGGTVNQIDISAHDPDRLHVAVYRYRENDFRPWVFQSNDSGRSWKLLTDGTNGIPETHFTRSVREDPVRRGLLFVGTEFGLYVSFDDGRHFQRFQQNLPVSPVTDMVIHRGDLVLSTQGRSFWILEDLSALRQITPEIADAGDDAPPLHLFEPALAYRGGDGARFRFLVREEPGEPVKLEVLDGDRVAYEAEWKPEQEDGEGDEDDPFAAFFGGGAAKLEVEKGLRTFSWNLREKAPEKPKGVVHWGFTPGLAVVPGSYTVRMTSGDWSREHDFEVASWPTSDTTQEEYEEQYEVGRVVTERLESIYQAIETIRDLESQIGAVSGRLAKADLEEEQKTSLDESKKELSEKLDEIEARLTQVKSESPQDPLNYPPMIDNQYVELYAYVTMPQHRPPGGAQERLADLDVDLDAIMADLDQVLENDVPAFNAAVSALELPAVAVTERSEDGP